MNQDRVLGVDKCIVHRQQRFARRQGVGAHTNADKRDAGAFTSGTLLLPPRLTRVSAAEVDHRLDLERLDRKAQFLGGGLTRSLGQAVGDDVEVEWQRPQYARKPTGAADRDNQC